MVYVFPNTSSAGGIPELLANESGQVPGLAAGILFFIYVVILSAGYFSQERRTGAGNFAMWSAISGLITTTGSFALFLFDGIVNLQVIVICVVVTMVSAVFFIVGERD